MEEWKEYKLEEVCKSIADGDHMPPPKSDKGIPFVTISNIVDNRLDFCNTHFVPQSYYDGLDSKRRPHIGDTIYSVVGTFGKPVYVKEEKPFVFQRHIAILRPDESKIVPQFLFYSLLSPQFYRKADVMAIGAVQRTISLTSLRNATIQLPSLKIQSKIVDMLSSIDDKIEVNRRINDNLEQQAQALFKSWFVDFEPFRNQPFVESELGMIPEGWRVGNLGELITTNKRSYKGAFSQPIHYLDTSSITNNYIDTIHFLNPDVDKIPSRARRAVTEGDIVFSSVRPNQRHYGLLFNPIPNMVVSTGFVVITSNWSGYRYFVYSYLTQDVIIGILQAIAEQSVSTFPSINASDIENLKLIIPPDEIIGKYAQLCVIICHQSEVLHQESRRLATLRDTLLPRLMSGELSVDGLKGQQAVSPGPLGDDRRRFHSEAEKERPGSTEHVSNTIAP